MRRAIFLDRDGTINEDPGYLSHPSQLKLFEGVGNALSQLKAAGYLLVVVSNQSGVARGLIPEEALSRIHQRLDEILEPWSVKIDRYQLCIHHPDEDCLCRKPKPKLILDAALFLGIDVKHSYMIGDRKSDVLAGNAAGCKASILVRTGDGKKTEVQLQKGQAAFIGDTLLHASHWILSKEG